jgi:hypothetical protein
MFKRVKIIKSLRFMRGSQDDSQPAAKCAARKQKIFVKRAFHETSSIAHILALLKEIEGLTSMGSESLYLVTTANRECRIYRCYHEAPQLQQERQNIAPPFLLLTRKKKALSFMLYPETPTLVPLLPRVFHHPCLLL